MYRALCRHWFKRLRGSPQRHGGSPHLCGGSPRSGRGGGVGGRAAAWAAPYRAAFAVALLAVALPAAAQNGAPGDAPVSPAAEQPATERPAAEQPATEQPTAEQPTAEQPTAERPTAARPTADGRSRAASSGASGGAVYLLTVHDAIGPATGHYIIRGIERAQDDGAPLVVLELDTPGGLDTSMRDIIQAILGSSVPVATFVHPQGARAASAGTYILYASHIAAMAPATNLGAATPVAIGGAPPAPAPADGDPASGGDHGDTGGGGNDAEPDSTAPASASDRKAINDAVAYIRALAERRDRNADWAERAVREAESLSASQALELDVIDIIASDVADLLAQIDGRHIAMPAGEVTLATQGITVTRIEPDWRTRFLAVITNPTIAYMLLMVGIYGLILEGYNPGAIVPGVTGAIALLLALFAFQILPVNYAGLALIALGVTLMVVEFFMPSFGALGVGGLAAFVIGSIILMDADVPGFGIATGLIGAIATVSALMLLGVIALAMRSRQRPVVSGSEQMYDEVAVALEDFAAEGPVKLRGEHWHARSRTPVRRGERVRVARVDGLVLDVVPDTGDDAPAGAPPHGRVGPWHRILRRT